MNAHEADLRTLFISLAESLAASDITQALDDLVTACVDHTSATEGGIVLADRDGVLHVVASTSERAAEVEEAQLGALEGPCMDCVRTGEPVEVPDLATAPHDWPEIARIAEDRGFRAVHATPMRLRGRTLGSLCLFAPTPGALSDRDAALVQTLADAATLSVLQQHAIDRGQAVADQLQQALDSRVVIEQAKGALAQRMGVSTDEAFAYLRRQARSSGRRIHDVAAEMVQPDRRMRA
ncbi:ANTAR domain-containing protein [Clavibacter lycopersici]|uniref:ANTAR domain-containing protein n=1 Tax=Clavibacter lycopersici TaxID=2301718 RepID=A0A399T587_9MICO|nr:GAF and ANTAR domain-containing protein [Clavibacter lycopersici]RIJ50289.1 ANTAR domain-containing protein [Clavibacter lycopersici]RIJ61146.1 ANTAR domain-containing protein [Clavibacter lycopersici]